LTRKHQQQRQRADQDEGALADVTQDVGGDQPDQPHVEPGVGQQVQQGPAEGRHAQQAPKARQRAPAGGLAQRRDGQRQAQQAQRPLAAGADQRLGRVGAEAVGGRAVQQQQQRRDDGEHQQRPRQRLRQQAIHRGVSVSSGAAGPCQCRATRPALRSR
jgi:hypothetical protein